MKLCPHSMNPESCPFCFNARPRQTRPIGEVEMSSEHAVDPIVAAVKARTKPITQIKSPTKDDPQDYKTFATQAANVKQQEPPPIIRKPIDPNAKPVEPPTAFTYDKPGADVDDQGNYVPPERPSLIDRLPSHPEANKS